MDTAQLSSRIAALRVEAAAVGGALMSSGSRLDPAEAFELAGELQAVVNAAEGAQAVAAGWGARVEERLTSAGPVQRTHPVGFVDQMSGAEVALAAGVTEGVGWRKVRLGAGLGERFLLVRELLVAGKVSAGAAHRLLDGCAGLDVDACRQVDEQLAPMLADVDPSAVARVVRRVANRVAADQIAARVAARKRTRCVEVAAGEDGLTSWWAVLPTATAAAAWSAVEQVAADYRAGDETLSVGESRADAFGDLLLRDVRVSASVTLGVPVVSGDHRPGPGQGSTAGSEVSSRSPAARPDRPGWSRQQVDVGDDEVLVDHVTGETTRVGDLSPVEREQLSWVDVPDARHPCGGEPASASVDPRYRVLSPLDGGRSVSGAELPGLGWVDSGTVAALLATVPVEVGRAVLDADTGTLVSLTTDAYTPSRAMREYVQTRDGICRMWGCFRKAESADLDHVRPWPAGMTSPQNLAALCRRHHRMKQRGRWRYGLRSDGTVDWVSEAGKRRVTEPVHRVIPVPENPGDGLALDMSPRPATPPVRAANDELPPF
ncbi:MAG: HNH endonuclease signature motif containing protein [Dermatophilaceae bacterium]